jgi:transaldolase
MMLGRFEDSKAFEESARKAGVTLNEELKRWAGIAIFKKAYNLLKKGDYESKLLAASMRIGPREDGKIRIWHIEKLVGGNVVLTIFPNVIEAFMINFQDERITSSIDEEVPSDVMKKLERIPYFMQAYEEKGIRYEDFISYPPTVETASSFSSAMDDIEQLVKTTISAQ